MKFPIEPLTPVRTVVPPSVTFQVMVGVALEPSQSPQRKSPMAEPSFSRFAGIVSEPSPIVAPVKIDVGVVVLTMLDPDPVTEKIGVRGAPQDGLAPEPDDWRLKPLVPGARTFHPLAPSVQDIALRVADPGVEQRR